MITEAYMGWVKQIKNISKIKKTLLLILAALMVVNDVGRLVSMLTDMIFLGCFVVVLVSGLTEAKQNT